MNGAMLLATIVAVATLGSPAHTGPGDRSAATQGALDVKRGALLYEDGCGECHTTRQHWREKHLVRTWPELLFQVERWQRVEGRGWTREEIEDVAAYLNGRFYRLECPVAGCLNKG